MTDTDRIDLLGLYRADGDIIHACSFAFVGVADESAPRPMTDAEFATYSERRTRGESPSWAFAVE